MPVTLDAYRVRSSDSVSVQNKQAIALFNAVQTPVSRFWDLIPFGNPILTHEYAMATRSRAGQTVAVTANVLTAATTISLNTTGVRSLTAGHKLYDPATKQTVTITNINYSTGVADIVSVDTQFSVARAQINSGANLAILSQAEDYHNITATSHYEETTEEYNFVEDLTEKLEFFRADTSEGRKYGVDTASMTQERITKILRELDRSILYNVPKSQSAGVGRAATGGWDYYVRKAGNVTVSAQGAGVVSLAELNAAIETLVRRGVSEASQLVMFCNYATFYKYNALGLATTTVDRTGGDTLRLGGIVSGIVVSGVGFVPFITDENIVDNDVRFVSLANCRKSIYKGEELRLIPEPSMSNSKKDVSTLQMKWGTYFTDVTNTQFILDNN